MAQSLWLGTAPQRALTVLEGLIRKCGRMGERDGLVFFDALSLEELHGLSDRSDPLRLFVGDLHLESSLGELFLERHDELD